MKRLFVVVLLFTIGSVQTIIAGTKPITGLPDYNGTYWGTPNTGSTAYDSLYRSTPIFTTLYRDNYSRTSGCAGERCGKHPGVDIAVTSGTPVVAALGGAVVEATCDWNDKRGLSNGAQGFGGLVIIESDNPYTSGKVYVVYAHLDNWSIYSVGQTVPEGEIIGYSGGDDITGVCPGASDGAHLHFQVDKFAPTINSRGNLTPWFPTGRVETADSDFEVTMYTHNPLLFVLGYAYHYTFAENNNKELWGAANVNDYNTANSDLWVDSESVYPYVGRSSYFGDVSCGESALCSREITLDADVFKRIVLNLDYRCINNLVTIYYRGPDDVWHGGSFNYDTARKYYVDMGGLSDWNGIVSDLIIKPSQGCTANPGPEEYFIKQVYLLP